MSDYATRTPAKTAAKPAAATLRPAQPGAWRAPRPTAAAARPAPAAKAPIRQPALTPTVARTPAAVAPREAAPPNAAARVLDGVLHWLPDFALAELSEEAQSFAGYPLLTLMLGYDPFTRQVRRRTAAHLVEALLAFDQDSLELYRAVVKSGALARAGQLIEDNAQRFHLGSQRVGELLHEVAELFKNHKLAMLRKPSLLLRPFRGVAADVVKFVRAVGPPLVDIIVPLLGQRGARVLGLLKKGQATFHKIVADPKAFLRNLVDGVKMGFQQFSDKALGYLGISFTTWLLSAFKPDGVAMPQQFDGPSLLKLGLRLLGLDVATLQQKLAKRLGPRGDQKMELLATAGGLVRTLVTQGPAAVGKELLDMAKGALSQLKTQVLDGVRSWLYQKLIVAGIAKLASLLSPASALFEALRETYETIVFFIERADKFTALLETIIGAFADIADRVLKPAADKVERTLASTLTLALDLLFRLLGLGGVPEQVKAQILKARKWIDETIDKYLDKFIDMAVKLFHKGKQVTKQAVGAVKKWLGLRKEFVLPNKEKHTLFFDAQGQLMLASDPHPYNQFLAQFHGAGGAPLTTEYQETKKRADSKSQEIQDLSNKRINLLADYEKAPLPKAKEDLALSENEHDLLGPLQELAALTEQLMQVSNAGEVDKDMKNPPAPLYGDFSEGGFGSGMRTEYYTSKGLVTTTGTVTKEPSPTDSSKGHANYDEELSLRKSVHSSNRPYYIQGHLQNEQLHGSGRTWQNLIPISESTNGLQRSRLESPFIKAIRRTTQPTAFSYSVAVQYGMPLRTNLLAAVDQREEKTNKGQTPSTAADYLLPEDADKLRRIIRAEQLLPLNLVAHVQEIDPDKRTPKPSGYKLEVVIPHLTDQSSLDAYALTAAPAAQRVKPQRVVEVNKIKSPEKLLNPLVVKLSPTAATAIFEVVNGFNNRLQTRFYRLDKLVEFIESLSHPEAKADVATVRAAAGDKPKRLIFST